MQHWTQRDSAGDPVTGRQPLPVPAPVPAKPSGIGFQAGAAVTSSEFTAGRTLVPVKAAPQNLSKAHFEACPHCGNTSAVHFMEWPARARWSCEQCKAAGPLCFAEVDARALSFGGTLINGEPITLEWLNREMFGACPVDPDMFANGLVDGSYGKTQADCAERFGNVHKFTGAPALPAPAKPTGWHLRSRTDYIEINLCGRADELEVEVFYDFEPAERGSRDSAPCAARVTIARVMAGAVDLLPVLPQSMVSHLAAMVLEDEGGAL